MAECRRRTHIARLNRSSLLVPCSIILPFCSPSPPRPSATMMLTKSFAMSGRTVARPAMSGRTPAIAKPTLRSCRIAVRSANNDDECECCGRERTLALRRAALRRKQASPRASASAVRVVAMSCILP
eukprot:356031-Chlamydomonas_euryale.AAC.9